MGIIPQATGMIFPEGRQSYLHKEKLHSSKKSSKVKMYINFEI